MTIYLIKGYLDVAATTLADAQSLYTALLDLSDADNVATLNRVTAKLETLVQSDTGEPLVISSIDDAAGTISSWVTDSSVVSVGIGDPDPQNSRVYASLTGLTISGSTRIGTLALNTTQLQAALAGYFGMPGRVNGANFTLQVQITSGGYTETKALLSVAIRPAVLTAQPTDLSSATYLTAAQVAAGYQPLDSDLTAFAAFSSTGILARTGNAAFSGRTITAGTGVTIANGNGVSGNPTISIGQNVATTDAPTFAGCTYNLGTGFIVLETVGDSPVLTYYRSNGAGGYYASRVFATDVTGGGVAGFSIQVAQPAAIGNHSFGTVFSITGVVPAYAAAAGSAGLVEFDSSYIYRCTATNTWKRAALSTW